MSVVARLREGGGITSSPEEIDDLLAVLADNIGCELNVLKAILEVESGGDAFDKHGRLIILPEKHVFRRQLPKELRAKALYIGLAAKRWTRANYKGLGGKGSDARWNLLQDMADLHETAALNSASYGSAQIMGFNHEICGYPTVTEFVLALAEDDERQISAFVAFLERSGLRQALRDRDFQAIARKYNGSGQVKRYAGMMLRAYRRLGGSGDTIHANDNRHGLRLGSEGYRVKALQERLRDLGYTVRPDGDFGPATKRAVVAFQSDHGLGIDGIVGPQTERSLQEAVPINRQLGSSREELTVKDLRKQGSKTVKNADLLTRMGQVVLGTGAAATGLDQASGGFLDGLGQITDMVQSVKAQVTPLLATVSDHKWLVFIGVGLGVIWIARQIRERRLDDARNWRHVG